MDTYRCKNISTFERDDIVSKSHNGKRRSAVMIMECFCIVLLESRAIRIDGDEKNGPIAPIHSRAHQLQSCV